MHADDEIIELTDIIEEDAPITSGLDDFPAENAVDPKSLDDELDALLEDVSPDLDPLADLDAPTPPQEDAFPAATEVLDPDADIVLNTEEDSPLAADDLDIFAETPAVADDAPAATAANTEPATPASEPSAAAHADLLEDDLTAEPDLGPASAEDADLLTEPDLAPLASDAEAPLDDGSTQEATTVDAPAGDAEATPDPEEAQEPALSESTEHTGPLNLPEDPEKLPFFPALMALVLAQVDDRLAAATAAVRQDPAPKAEAPALPDLDTWAAPLREELAALRAEIATLSKGAAPKAPEAAPSADGILPEDAAALRQTIAAQNAEIEAVRAQVAARDAEVAALKQQLAARDAQITALAARLDAMAQTMENVNANLEERIHTLIEDEAPRVAARAIREELAALMAEAGQE
ncbi:MAG: hypothetical protein PWQ64_822 [Desulfomicrobiaceae bacterium]|nr:hypothetical protein [Desulfomicrobiaceae bacterium]